MTQQSSMPNLSARLKERNQQALAAMQTAAAHSELCMARIQRFGPTALLRLVEVANGDSGQSHHCRRILLAIYNGSRWPLDPTRLRALDGDLQQAALITLEWATFSRRELHEYLDDGEKLMRRFRLIETGGRE